MQRYYRQCLPQCKDLENTKRRLIHHYIHREWQRVMSFTHILELMLYVDVVNVYMVYVENWNGLCGGECLKAQKLELYESKLTHGVFVS